jgi:hypothetical protein
MQAPPCGGRAAQRLQLFAYRLDPSLGLDERIEEGVAVAGKIFRRAQRAASSARSPSTSSHSASRLERRSCSSARSVSNRRMSSGATSW